MGGQMNILDEEFAELILKTNGWRQGIMGQTDNGLKKRFFNFLTSLSNCGIV